MAMKALPVAVPDRLQALEEAKTESGAHEAAKHC
jgi:hypothetical protein